MLGGVFRSSISLVVIMVEGTGGITFVFCIIVAVVVSNAVSSWLQKHGVYHMDLNRNEHVAYLSGKFILVILVFWLFWLFWYFGYFGYFGILVILVILVIVRVRAIGLTTSCFVHRGTAEEIRAAHRQGPDGVARRVRRRTRAAHPRAHATHVHVAQRVPGRGRQGPFSGHVPAFAAQRFDSRTQSRVARV